MSTLVSIAEVYAGGPGSGCNPQAGTCGRPKSGLQQMLEQAKGAWGHDNLWSRLAEFGQAGVVAPFSKEELQTLSKLKPAKSCKIGMCFMNAQQIASNATGDNSLRLKEGLVTVHGIPIDHSWVEYNGKVYDPTLAKYRPGQEPDYSRGGTFRERAEKDIPDYVGVDVPKDEITKHWLSTKHYAPLSHDWHDERLMKRIWRKPQ